MKNNLRKIDRRSFVGKTGTAIAGITFIPGFISHKTLPDAGMPLLNYRGPLAEAFENNTSSDRWWESEPMRIIEFEEGYEFREKFGLLKELGANMEHVTRFTDTSPGTSFLDAHNLFHGKKVDFNSLEEYMEEAHKAGIRVIIYYNVHAIEINYARKHPGWQQIKDDGKPIEDVYSVDSSFCINSPWREEVFATLRKLAEYKIDGVFYDGPIFFSSTCHCDSCRKLFLERFNRELPSKTQLSAGNDNPAWKDLLEFQSDSIARFLRESNNILKKANRGILFYMNGNTLAPSWPTARENRKIIKETDILGAEGGFLYGEFKEPVYKPGAMAKLLETQAGGKPTVVFDAAKQGPWTFSNLPSGEISILYSQTITHQANVWLAVSSASSPDENAVGTIKRYNRFIAENPDPFFKTVSMARIALVWPQESGNFYRGSSVPLTDFTKEMKQEKAGNTEDEFYGFYMGLSGNHCPFDVLDEQALEGDLSRYDLLILPNLTCLSSKRAGQIKDFVAAGGKIISTFETSALDENGDRLDKPGLCEVFGIENSGDVFGPLAWDYVMPVENGHFALKDIRNKYLYAPSYGVKVETGGKSPVMFCKPLPGSYSGSPELSDMPFIIDNKFGKGRSLYIAGTFGSSLRKFNFPEYYRILGNIVTEFSGPLIRMTNTPSSVEVNIRQKGNAIFIYLINFTSEMKRPIVTIIPCSNIGIEFFTAGKVKEVRSLWQNKKLKYRTEEGRISLSLPYLSDYEVIRIIV